MSKKLRVGILFGGKSVEHEISILSAKNVVEALDKKKYEPLLIGIDKKGHWHFVDHVESLLESKNLMKLKISNLGKYANLSMIPSKSEAQLVPIQSKKTIPLDVIFPILHGPFGEDGTVQGFLKLANIPFVGPGVLGSAICMDKAITKKLLKEAGISIADFITLKNSQIVPTFSEIISQIGLPFFIKPANLGSSVGIHKVKDETDFTKAIQDAFQYDSKVLLEKSIEGRELECGVLGNDMPIASAVGEIIPQYEFYSYEAKYLDENGAKLKIPADLSREIIQRVQALSIQVFKILECEGMARVDYFLTKDLEILVSEVNTIPGFTKISMYPKLFEAVGISYSSLIDRLIQFAIERFNKEKKLKTSL